ncbi:MAG TPA: hypothetical protein VG604_00375 [Candidatus Saccharimonadales bacterium]|nr:hypothetical protein [Candidatus Saccharimonadales bacterium]
MAKQRSIDDVLENERPGKLNSRIGQHGLPQDAARPAQPSKSSLNNSMSKDHPSRDSNVDSDEEYQEG